VLQVKPTGQRDRCTATGSADETETKPSPAPLQKYSLGGCTIDMPSARAYRLAARYLLI